MATMEEEILAWARQEIIRIGRQRLSRVGKIDKPWMNNEILTGIKARRLFNRKKRNSENNAERNIYEKIYNEQKCKVQAQISEAIAKYEEKLRIPEPRKSSSTPVMCDLRNSLDKGESCAQIEVEYEKELLFLRKKGYHKNINYTRGFLEDVRFLRFSFIFDKYGTVPYDLREKMVDPETCLEMKRRSGDLYFTIDQLLEDYHNKGKKILETDEVDDDQLLNIKVQINQECEDLRNFLKTSNESRISSSDKVSAIKIESSEYINDKTDKCFEDVEKKSNRSSSKRLKISHDIEISDGDYLQRKMESRPLGQHDSLKKSNSKCDEMQSSSYNEQNYEVKNAGVTPSRNYWEGITLGKKLDEVEFKPIVENTSVSKSILKNQIAFLQNFGTSPERISENLQRPNYDLKLGDNISPDNNNRHEEKRSRFSMAKDSVDKFSFDALWPHKNIVIIGDTRVKNICRVDDVSVMANVKCLHREGATLEKVLDIASKKVTSETDIVVFLSLHCEFINLIPLFANLSGPHIMQAANIAMEEFHNIMQRMKECSRSLGSEYPNLIQVWTLPFIPDFFKYNTIQVTRLNNFNESSELADQCRIYAHDYFESVKVMKLLWELEMPQLPLFDMNNIKIPQIVNEDQHLGPSGNLSSPEVHTSDGVHALPFLARYFWVNIRKFSCDLHKKLTGNN